jgi:hypothetical protein
MSEYHHLHKFYDVSDSGTNHISDAGWDAPRLATALLSAPPGADPVYKTTYETQHKAGDNVTPSSLDDALPDLLQHIYDRLLIGLNEAWLSEDGYGKYPDLAKVYANVAQQEDKGETKKALDAALAEATNLVTFWNLPEEQWARAFAELVVFSAYGGAGTNYGVDGGDESLYSLFPRAYPLIMACQHLATLCILSRGFPLSDVSSDPGGDREVRAHGVIGCGCTAGVVSFEAFQARDVFENGAKYRTIDELRTVKDKGGRAVKLTPGSVLVFNGGGPKVTDQNHGGTTHIASVFRTTASRVQFIDTGVLTNPDVDGKGQGGTADHGFFGASAAIPAHGDMIAVGVLKEASGVDDLAAKMICARPLGVVRLVILDVSRPHKPKVRFVSKLLQMRLPVSRLIWSLRKLPVQDLRVLWYVYAPQNAWADAMIGDVKAAVPASEAVPAATAPSTLFGTSNASLLMTNVLSGDASGQVTVHRHKIAIHVTTEPDPKDKTKKVTKEVPQNLWAEGFSLSTSDEQDKALRAKLGWDLAAGLPGGQASTLRSWCGSQSRFGQQLICKQGDDKGTADDGKTGVAFFDP